MKKLFLIATALFLSTTGKSQQVNQDKFTNFDCHYIGGKVNISWEFNCESDKEEFFVERTDSVKYGDYVQYSKVGRTRHSYSHSDIQNPRKENYSFMDMDPLPGKSYYRITVIKIQNDKSEATFISEVKTIYNNYYPNDMSNNYSNDLGKATKNDETKLVN